MEQINELVLYGHPEYFKGGSAKCLICGDPISSGNDIFKVGFQLTSFYRYVHVHCYEVCSKIGLRAMLIVAMKRPEKSWFNNGVGCG